MSKREYNCSFCGLGLAEVRRMVAGPTAFICDACIQLSVDILATNGLLIIPSPSTVPEKNVKRPKKPEVKR